MNQNQSKSYQYLRNYMDYTQKKNPKKPIKKQLNENESDMILLFTSMLFSRCLSVHIHNIADWMYFRINYTKMWCKITYQIFSNEIKIDSDIVFFVCHNCLVLIHSFIQRSIVMKYFSRQSYLCAGFYPANKINLEDHKFRGTFRILGNIAN